MFNDMNSEEQLAAARALLTAERAPMNTANLNRAMAALSQGQAQLPAMSAADRPTPTARRRAPPEFNGNNPQNAATQPSVATAAPLAAATSAPTNPASAAPPSATAPVVAAAPPVAPVVGDTQEATASVPVAAAPMSGMDNTLEAMMGNGPRTSVDNFMGDAPATLVVSDPAQSRGDVVAARVESGRRIGSANGAARINEYAPERGMFAGAPERLATDVEDPTGLGLTLLAMGAGGVGAAARYGIPAAETIGAQASRLVAGDRAVRAAEATQAAQQAASRSIAEQARMGTRGTVPAPPTPPTPPKPRISVRADSRPSAPQAQPAAPAAPPSVPRDNTLIPSSGRPDIVPAPPLVPPVPAAPVMQVAPQPQLMLNGPPPQLMLTGPGPQAMLSGPPRLPMITNQSLPSAAEVAAMSGRNMQGGRNLVPGPRANLAPGPRRGAQGTTPESPTTMNVPASVREAMRRRIFESIR